MRASRQYHGLLMLPLWMWLPACQPNQPTTPGLPPSASALEGTWLQVVEDVRGDTLTYRRNTAKFSPKTPRPGLRFGPFGRFVQYDLLPRNASLVARSGTWAANGRARLLIHLSAGPKPDFILEILRLTPQQLQLQRQRPGAVLK